MRTWDYGVPGAAKNTGDGACPNLSVILRREAAQPPSLEGSVAQRPFEARFARASG